MNVHERSGNKTGLMSKKHFTNTYNLFTPIFQEVTLNFHSEMKKGGFNQYDYFVCCYMNMNLPNM